MILTEQSREHGREQAESRAEPHSCLMSSALLRFTSLLHALLVKEGLVCALMQCINAEIKREILVEG